MSNALQLPLLVISEALAVSATASGLTWTLEPGAQTQSGSSPQFVRLNNIGSVTAFVNISNDAVTEPVIPGSETVGNTIPVAPNSFIDVQLFDQSGPANSIFNDGNGYCYINAITVESTTILVITPVQPV